MRWSIHLFVLLISMSIALGGASDFDIDTQLSEADGELYFESNHELSKRATTLDCMYDITHNSVVMETRDVAYTYYTSVSYRTLCWSLWSLFYCTEYRTESRTGYYEETYYVLQSTTETIYYSCYNGGTCNSLSISECVCTTGWEDDDCSTDIDECTTGVDPCSLTEICTNTAGSYTCPCRVGYSRIGVDCTDINECLTSPCGTNEDCNNNVGSYTCTCMVGYTLDATAQCADINECSTNNGGCTERCTNTIGSYLCEYCSSGYRWNSGNQICDNIDECAEGISQCEQNCIDGAGDYSCSCNTGYRMILTDSTKCEDINECDENTDGCEHNCVNLEGSYRCECMDGYTLDGKLCSDINECNLDTDDCEQDCTNTVGSYSCSCNPDYYQVSDISCSPISFSVSASASVTSSSSISLDWTTTYSPATYTVSLSYGVYYRDMTFSITSSFIKYVETTTLQQDMNDLLPYREYELYVIAIGNLANKYSNTVTVRTDQDIPSMSPTSVTVSADSATEISISWSAPSMESQNGIIVNYVILINAVEYTISVSSTFYTITDLAPYTTYTVSVAAATSVGIGLYSSSITIKTHESTPTSPPLLSVTTITHTTITLTLLPPTDTTTLNGVITFYTVSYTGVSVDTSTLTVRVTPSTTDNLLAVDVTLVGLQEGVSYDIQVAVCTSVDCGPDSDVITETTNEIAPTATPQNIQFTSILTTSLSLSWDSPPLVEQNGVITGYQLLYMGVSIDTAWREVNVTSRSATLTALEEGSEYSIEISAINNAGVGPKKINLVTTAEIAPTGTPLNVVVRSDSSSSISIKWSPLSAEDENGVITGFQIEVVGREHDSNIYTRNVSENIREYTLGGLEEGHFYEVTLRAYNEIGYGPATNPIILSTLESAPGSAPQNLEATSGKTWMYLEWDAPAIADQNGDITTYEIAYKDLTSSTNIFINTTDLYLNITNLEEHEIYIFQIRAYTAIGSGPYSTILAVRTLEDVPSAPPINTQGYVLSATEIRFEWESPPLIDQNGVLIGFSLKINSEDNTYQRYYSFAASRNSYTFSDLHPYTNYSIQVRAETNPGPGPYTEPFTAETQQAAPSGTPNNVEFVIFTTSISIRWQSVAETEQNGIITGYIVKYRGLALDTATRNLTTVYRYATLNNLKAGNQYEISISATSYVGIGPYLTVYNTTEEIAPTEPPSNLIVKPSGSISLLISWNQPSLNAQNGVIIGYLIVVVGLQHDSSVYQIVTNSTVRSHTLSGLEEGHLYYVSMSATNSAGYGPFTQNISVTTNDAAPSSAPQDVNAIANTTSLFIIWSTPPTPDHNGIIIKYEVNYIDLVSGANNSLFETELRIVITNLHENELFQIQVRAYTSFGPGPYSTVVYVQTLEGPPSAAPTTVNIVSFSDTEIIVEWLDPPIADQNGVLTEYEINVETVDSTYEHIFSVHGSINTFTITNLHPYTYYIIQIRANTQPGSGPYSTPLTITTEQVAPSGPPQNVQLIVSTTYITLSWEAPDFDLQNGNISSYSITYSGVTIDITERTVSTSFTSLTLSNLEEGTEYDISICAYTIAFGPCAQIDSTTSEAAPAAAPANFQVVAITSTRITISWGPPALQYQNGIITGYEVIAVGQQHDTNVYEDIVSEYTLSYEFDNLEEFHEYQLQVRVRNAIGFGPYSGIITVVTSEDVSGGAPLNLTYKSTASTIKLSWSEPLIHLQNGELLYYEVEYYALSSYLSNIHSTLTNVSSSQTYITIYNLHEDVLYQLKVRAYTSFGPGPYSIEVSVRTKQAIPSSAPTNFHLITLSATQIQSTWGPPPVLEQNGQITGYELSVNSSTNSTTQIYTTTLTSYIFQYLQPNSQYTIQIRAINSIGAGPYTAYNSATTQQSLPSSPPTDLKLTVISAYQILVKWLPPPVLEQNGEITGYDVRLVSTINSFQQIYSTIQTQFTIESLHPDTNYSIQVRAKNSIGPSPYTALITTITLEALPSSPPTDFSVSVLSATQIQVEYDYPLAINQNGAITGFDISVTSSTESIQHIFSTDVTSYILQSLHPYTSYSIQIRANNSIGDGPYTGVMIATTYQALPADAPTGFTILQVTHNSVNFSWNQISSSSLNGEFVSYSVLVTDTRSTTSFLHSSVSPHTLIPNLTPFTEYSLSVAVINTHGTGPYSPSDLTFTTLQSSPSQGPEILSIQDITNTSALVPFLAIPTYLQNGPILSYTLSLYTSADSVLVTSLTLYSLSHTLTNLLPFIEYTVEITASNSAGTSPPTSTKFVTAEYVPTGAPTSISATPYSTYVILVYQPPVVSVRNGIIINYSIKFGTSISTTTYTTNLTEYTINDLEELTQFVFSIAASTSVGIGPYSTELSVTTLSSPPSVAPQNVTAIPQSYQSIFVSWNPVPDIHHNGEIISYIVYYQGEQYDTSERKQVEPASSTSATLQHLKPYEFYRITVVAENNQGPSPNSAPIIVLTYEGSPSVAPTGFTAISISATSIRTKWTAIPSDETNGILTQYEIIYQSDSTFDSSQYKFTTLGNVTEAVLDDLHPAVEYQLFVRGYTSVGNGPNSIRSNIILPESNPSGPPEITVITVASQTEIYVAWLGIILSERNGVITAYEVKYSSKSPQASEIYPTFYQNTTGEILDKNLTGLEVGTEYEIGVRGYTAVGPGPYSTFLTGTTAPALINCYEFFDVYFYNPCYHNGICLPDDNKAYRCQCVAGYTGPNCFTDIDDCEDNQCERGYCIDQVNGYICHCDVGYTGEYCDYNIDNCGDNACLNGAVCVDGIEEYSCNCTDNYSGIFCQYFNTCVASPCVHGSCHWESYSYTCTCEPGYEGENCSINIDDCKENSCQYGKCVDQLESYECDCYKGFKGEYCEIPSNGDTCKHQEVAGFYWKETGYGDSRTLPCGLAIKGLTGNATRYCKPDGAWADLDISDCARPSFRDLDFNFKDYIQITGELDPTISIDLLDRLSQVICTNQTAIVESIEPTFYPYEISVITEVLTELMVSIEAQNISAQAMMISQMTPGLLCVISRIVNIGNLQIFTFTNSSLKAIDINQVIEKIAKLNAKHFDTTNSDPTLFSEENIHMYITPLTNGQSVTLPDYELSAVKDTGLYPDNVFIPESEVSDLFSKSNGEVPVIAVVFSRYLGQAMGAHSQSTTLDFSPIGTRVITMQTSLGQPLTFTSPITLEYWVFDPYNTSQVALCVAWDGIKWSDEGLYLSERTKHTISCYSTHTTSFAILFSLQTEPPVPEEEYFVLTMVTYALGAISFISLVTSVILLLILGKDLLKSDLLICQFNLAIALILALIFCVIGLHPITSIPITCQVFTILFQYSTLASACWIFCIAVQSIYMLFARNRLMRTFFIFLPIGWVIPLIITAATGGISWVNYGVLDSYCWISEDSTTFWMIAGPILALAVIDVVLSFFLVCRISMSKPKREWHNQARRTVCGLVLLSIMLFMPWIMNIINLYIPFAFFKWTFAIKYTTQGLLFLLSIVLPIKLIKSKVFRFKNKPDTTNQGPQLRIDTRRPSQRRLLSVSDDFTYQLSPPGANSDYFNPLYNAINLDPDDMEKLDQKESYNCTKETIQITMQNVYDISKNEGKEYLDSEITKFPLDSPYQSMKRSGTRHEPAGYDNPYMEITEDSTANPFIGLDDSKLQASAETHINPFSTNVDKDESNIYSEPRDDDRRDQPNVECREKLNRAEDVNNPQSDTPDSSQDDMLNGDDTTNQTQFVDEGFAHENPTYSALPASAQINRADTGFENPSYMAVGTLNLTEPDCTDNADTTDV